jgi:hypothetical protein
VTKLLGVLGDLGGSKGGCSATIICCTSTTNAQMSEFPSGDGNSGGACAFLMTLLAGDRNFDAAVTVADDNLFIDSRTPRGGRFLCLAISTIPE